MPPKNEWIEKTELLAYSYFPSTGAVHYHLWLLAADMGNAGLRKAHEAERWTRSGRKVVEPSRLKDDRDFIASVVVVAY